MTPVASPSADRVDAPFWAGLAQGDLRIQRCAACAHWTWPPQWRCGQCGSWELGWPIVAAEGIVHALTRTRHPFSPETVGRTPYPVLLVELPGAGGARLLGLLDGVDGNELVIGAAVRGVIEATPTGLPALRWRLTEGGR